MSGKSHRNRYNDVWSNKSVLFWVGERMEAKAKRAKEDSRSRRLHRALSVVLFMAEIAVLAAVYYSPALGYALQWGVALASLFVVGAAIKRLNGLNGWAFMYLLGSRKGLSAIDRLSRRARPFWNEMAVWGLVLGFGVLSYPLFRRMISKKQYAFGLLSLAVILFVVLPYLAVALPLINIPQLQGALSGSQASSGPSLFSVAFDAIAIIAGFAGYVFAALMYNAVAIIYGIAAFASTALAGSAQPSLLTTSLPGVAPIIPGIDIPLFAGIISLAILLIVHEVSHGLLAREAKVRLKSLGLLILGIVPVGAFVEPDEKQVSRLDKARRTKIFSAGISANFVAMLVFFVLMLAFMYGPVPQVMQGTGVFVSATVPGYPAYNALQPGTQILYWNGNRIDNLSSFATAAKGDVPNATVTVVTANGTYTFRAKAVNSTRAIIGVDVYEAQGVKPGYYAAAVYFLYTVFALSFMLNFLVAVVNLLPLPGFDGWQIYQANIRSKAVLKYIMIAIVIGLLVNVLQWVFYI